MAELPKQLPGLRQKLTSTLDELVHWQKLAKQHQFTADVQYQIALLLACHQAAQQCADGDAVRALQATDRARQSADRWRVTPSERESPQNMLNDHYAGIHDDTLATFYATATEIIENVLDWIFTVASARAAQFRMYDSGDEPAEFHAEDAILLCQMQALCACCEAILPIYLEHKEVAAAKVGVAQYEIAAWKALVLEGTQLY